MKAARDRLSGKTHSPESFLQQGSIVQIRKNDAQLARAAPNDI
jgi:hypothetical protein